LHLLGIAAAGPAGAQSACHGIEGVSGGVIADLRYAAAGTYDIFDDIVRGGAYQNLGMPRFDWLRPADVSAIKAYGLSRREALRRESGTTTGADNDWNLETTGRRRLTPSVFPYTGAQ
jgi:hypothetical protein